MGRFAVLRFGFMGCGNHHHHLSLVCPLDWSVYENLELPFDINEAVGCGSCGGLFFQGSKGTMVICNLTTQQMKVLPPPNFEPPPHVGKLRASCLGYDATSKDYKVIRYYDQFYYGEADEDGRESYLCCKSHFDLYSFKCGSWRDIPTPDACIMGSMGVYVGETGCCYWTACLESSFGGLKDDPFRHHVLSFDFATESFGHFPPPAPTTGKCEDGGFGCTLVECYGSLGALVSWRPDGYRSSSPLSIELFVWKGMSWNMLYVVSLAHVKGIAGLVDNNLLILEVKHSSRSGQLMVYDLQTGRSKKLSIYDYPKHMTFHSYVACKDLLPDSKPITMIPYVESTDPLPITSEDEEEKVTWKMMLKNHPIRRRGSKMKRKRKRTGTVSKNNPASRKRRRLTSNQ
ncbi:hypothetical protein OROHE_014312 [Orobanche hederae]